MITKSVLNNIHDESHLKNWHCKEIEILSVIANPKDNRSSPDAMPLFEARLVGAKDIEYVHIDEVSEQDWPDEMKATLAGMKAYKEGDNSTSDYTEELAKYFEYGKELADYKEGL
jgi:hypothetical protein